MRGKSTGENEIYCEFFECTECEESNLTDDSNFCPDCGKPTGDNEFTRNITNDVDVIRTRIQSRGNYSIDSYVDLLNDIDKNLQEIRILVSKGSI
jgi:uncharacterized membrane protein YvbJ